MCQGFKFVFDVKNSRELVSENMANLTCRCLGWYVTVELCQHGWESKSWRFVLRWCKQFSRSTSVHQAHECTAQIKLNQPRCCTRQRYITCDTCTILKKKNHKKALFANKNCIDKLWGIRFEILVKEYHVLKLWTRNQKLFFVLDVWVLRRCGFVRRR